MKFKNHLFFGLIFSMLILLSAFAYHKNNQRKIEQINIDFKNDRSKFLSPLVVNKLLIQIKGELPWEIKDSLALNMLETFLENNPYIHNAEIFSFLDGTLGVNIQEKKPLVCVQGKTGYYMDDFGSKFPISKSYKAIVPVYEGELEEHQKNQLLMLMNALNQDPFFKRELKTIYHKSNTLFIGLKSYDFEVEMGSINKLNDKLARLKVFCAYQDNNELKKKYRLISLKFKNQIVGS